MSDQVEREGEREGGSRVTIKLWIGMFFCVLGNAVLIGHLTSENLWNSKTVEPTVFATHSPYSVQDIVHLISEILCPWLHPFILVINTALSHIITTPGLSNFSGVHVGPCNYN